jgi:hypothetical protein
MRQHVPATVRRWRHMRRTAIVLLSPLSYVPKGNTPLIETESTQISTVAA